MTTGMKKEVSLESKFVWLRTYPDILEEVRDQAIDEVLTAIDEVAPEIVIIEQ